MGKKQHVRPIFIYLVIIAVILGTIGIIIIERGLSGRAIEEKSDGNSYTKEEIAEHNNKQECWIYLENKVYDITLLLQIYPYDLSQECGKELKAGYFSEEDVKILDNYEIGNLK